MLESIKSLWLPERGVNKLDEATHLVQIIDEPLRILVLKVWDPLIVLLPTKYVADLVVKLGRRPVEAMELFQGVG